MKTIPLFLALLFSLPGAGQHTLFDSVNRTQTQINRTGMVVLGSWALFNIGSGVVGQANTLGRQRQFFKTNIIWGGVNLLLAGVGYIREKNQQHSPAKTFHNQSVTEKLFLFNTALDLGYMVFGLYLRERANGFTGDKQERLLGTGDSFLLQGGFLFFFDGIMYIMHAKNGSRLFSPLNNLSINRTENGLGLLYRF